MRQFFPHHPFNRSASISSLASLQGVQQALAKLVVPIARTEHVAIANAVGRVMARSPLPAGFAAAQQAAQDPGTSESVQGLEVGTRLEVSHMPMLLHAGVEAIEVVAHLRVGVVTLVGESSEPDGQRLDGHGRVTAATLVSLLDRLGARAFQTTCRLSVHDSEAEALSRQLSSFKDMCDLVILAGFLAPRQTEAVRRALSSETSLTTVRDLVIRPLGSLQVIQSGGALAIGVSSLVDLAVPSFVTLVSPLVRWMQGRADWLPKVASAKLRPELFCPFDTTGIFHVKETIDPSTHEQELEPCRGAGAGGAVMLAQASGLAWRPADSHQRCADDVVYYPFHRWMS